MKLLVTFAFAIIITIIYGCKKDSEMSNSPSVTKTQSYDLNGNATVEGRIGYFEIVQSPPGSDFIHPYPSGYILGEYTWITIDTPRFSDKLYITGDYGQYNNRFVRVTGSWIEIIKTIGTEEYKYTELSVDSLQIIQ